MLFASTWTFVVAGVGHRAKRAHDHLRTRHSRA
jgi:hypothetical protein